MSEKETIEGNKLIALFDGYEFTGALTHPNNPLGYFKKEIEGGGTLCKVITDLEYHESWDELMPIIEKIESIGEGFIDSEDNYHVCMTKGYTRVIYSWSSFLAPLEGDSGNAARYFDSFKDYRHIVFDNNKLLSTFTAVVDFIKWFNEKNKTT